MVIFDMTAHPFSLSVWRHWPFSANQKREKSNMADFFAFSTNHDLAKMIAMVIFWFSHKPASFWC